MDALAYWFGPDTHTYVAESHGHIVGTSILKPNQPALGSSLVAALSALCPERFVTLNAELWILMLCCELETAA